MDDIFGLSSRRGRLHNQVADQAQELIIADWLKPGDKLPGERELAERLGLSRTVGRKAIQALIFADRTPALPGTTLSAYSMPSAPVGQTETQRPQERQTARSRDIPSAGVSWRAR